MRLNVAPFGRPEAPQRRGYVLIAVLIVVTAMSLAAYRLADLMSNELQLSENSVRAAQAKAAADSGIHYAMAVLADPTNYSTTINSNPFNNSAMSPEDDTLLGISGRARFRLLAPLGAEDGTQPPYRFGVLDEGGKLNLNTLMAMDGWQGDICKTALMQLPIMQNNDALAESIVSWMAPPDTRDGQSTDNQFYGSQTPPYQCKCAPLDTLDEMLLINGMTPAILYGDDLNHSGIQSSTQQGSSGTFSRGLLAYVTIYSSEPNFDANGNPRVNINRSIKSQSDVTKLITDIQTAFSNAGVDGTELANYIVAARLYGAPAATDSSGKGGGTKTSSSQASIPQTLLTYQDGMNTSNNKITSLYTLINSQITVQQQGQPQNIQVNGGGGLQFQVQGRNTPPVTYASPLNDQTTMQNLAPALFDELTTSTSKYVPARVNINTAPVEVMQALPGLTSTDTNSSLPATIVLQRQQFMQRDGQGPSSQYQTPIWLLNQSTTPVTTAFLMQMETFITAKTNVYRVQSIGDFENGGPAARVEAVVEIFAHRPRIKFYRDLTEFGKGVDDGN